MRKYILFFFLILISYNSSYAYDFLLTGSTIQENGGKVVLPNSLNGVYINNDNYLSNTGANLQIRGNFWHSDLSSTTDQTLGWITFDIGTVIGVPKVTLKNNLDGTFTFTGYARSHGGGWIYFGNTGVANGTVTYNTTTGLINGCAWSQNLGWICIDTMFIMDTTPPDLTSILKPTATNYKATTFSLNETATIKIENWNSSSMTTYANVNSFKHDMRKTKFYYIEATDLYGNTSSGYIQVVAGIPNENLSIYDIGGGATATLYGGTLGTSKIADGNEVHNINIKLKDTFGNSIIPVVGVKDVKVTLGFSNTVDYDQITNMNCGDSIRYDSVNFNTLLYGICSDTSSTATSSNGNYNVNISSYSPSTTGYSYTTPNNDIKVNKLNISITALGGNTGVGEYTANMVGIKYTEAFKFEPAVKITNITNSDNGNIIRDNETSFTGTITINKRNPSSIQSLKVTHILDIMTGSTYQNNIINYQNILGLKLHCKGFYTGTGYYADSPDCNKSTPYNSSNLIKNLGNISINTNIYDIFRTTPRLITSGLSKFDTNYSSEISYTINGNNIKYPSLTNLFSSSVNNSEVKIAGLVNKNNNNFSVIQDSSINYIGNITKSDVYAMIHKNVYVYQKSGTGTNGVMYKKGDYILNSWPVGIDTLIVDGGDLIIDTDISKVTGMVKIIVATKKADGTKGNIWIKNHIQKIYATLIADRSVISGDGTNYYTDTTSPNDQLFVKGSVISYNTIGGASSTPNTCPYYITTICDLKTAKRYDFNHFRSYIKGIKGTQVSGITINSGYDIAPMIIEYDSDIQKTTPSILKNS